MEKLTKQMREQYDAMFDQKKDEIVFARDSLVIHGQNYYVSNLGDDNNDGLSPEMPWRSLEKVSAADLKPGDGVLFRRGDLFRGSVYTKSGVTYGAYGQGPKPKFYGCEMSLADPALWEEVDTTHHIWKCREKMPDAGTIVFNEGEAHSRKLIPSYKHGRFVCREDESRVFDISVEMTKDLDLFWKFDEVLTTVPSKGEDFPIPDMEYANAKGDIYLRCDKGNPGEIYTSVEALSRVHMFRVGSNENVRIDNLCIKYVGMHGISAYDQVSNLHVSNCEIGWIGGCIQHYLGTDPNYPQGGRGTVTRFGNAIEIYGGCQNYVAENNYIYQVYDAGITHQITTSVKISMKGIRYTGNVIEKCVYGIEYFLEQIGGETESCMEDVVMNENFIRLCGYGWGQQRHNVDTPALIKGWSYRNTARDYHIYNNIFDRCAYRMLHLVALKDAYCPKMHDNVYIQYLGGMLGQYGGNEFAEPENLIYNENAEQLIAEVFMDKDAKVYL